MQNHNDDTTKTNNTVLRKYTSHFIWKGCVWEGMCHFRHPWNGMFVRHRAEITVMQFTGPSLPVHQSVTVPWNFNPVPYCQLSSPTPMEYSLPPSLEWSVWWDRRSIYNTHCHFLYIFNNASAWARYDTRSILSWV